MTSGGNFIIKPSRGWLHPDHLVSNDGITYAVRVRIQFPVTKNNNYLLSLFSSKNSRFFVIIQTNYLLIKIN